MAENNKKEKKISENDFFTLLHKFIILKQAHTCTFPGITTYFLEILFQ